MKKTTTAAAKTTATAAAKTTAAETTVKAAAATMTLSFNNLRQMDGENSAFDFVRFLVYRYGYMTNYAKIKKDMEAIEAEHAGVDAWEIADDSEELKTYFGSTAAGKDALAKFVAARKICNDKLGDMEILKARGVTYEKFAELSVTDKIFITLAAHTQNTGIMLDADLFKEAGVDIAIENTVEEYYTKGHVKNVKDKLRTIFAKTVGTQGNLFYAVKLKKSDFSDEDTKNFTAIFGGKDKRVKNADGTYSLKWVYSANTAAALTKLFAVVLDSHKNYEVIKDNEAAEKAASTEKHGGITLDEEPETTAA